MSSTEEQLHRRLDAFFRERLAPLAERLRARGVRFYPKGPDPSAESAWLSTGDEPEFERFEGPADLATALSDQWAAEDLPELAALAPELAALADSLEIAEDEAGDVSPFIYVMY